MDRKLAAILAADVVGYSAMMERDETGTHERLQASLREVFEPTISKYHGVIFKLMGDGLLAEFISVGEAVECAVTLQLTLAERNGDLPEERALRVRIGVNLGEVIVEGQDRFGEGVNIAARLEQLAEPGGIWVSAKVAKEVEKKLAFSFEAMGAQKVKNISERVDCYRVRMDGQPSRRSSVNRRMAPVIVLAGLFATMAASGLILWAVPLSGLRISAITSSVTDRVGVPIIAVLPFQNMSGDPKLDYFSDGMTNDLISMLTGVSELKVMSGSATYAYKDKRTDVRQIGRDLGVAYVIEGGIWKEADRLRITAQLTDAQTGEHVWAEKLDKVGTDPLALQDQVVERIVATVGGQRGKMYESEYRKVWEKDTPKLAEYDYFLRSNFYFQQYNPRSLVKAREIIEEGLKRFPDSALLMFGLAWDNVLAANYGYDQTPEQHWQQASAILNETLARPSLGPDAKKSGLWSFSYVNAHEGKFDKSLQSAQEVMALSPGDAFLIGDLSSAYRWHGLTDKAIELADFALRSDPNNAPYYLSMKAFVFTDKERYAESAKLIDGTVDFFVGVPLLRAINFVNLGKPDDAHREIGKVLAQQPWYTAARWRDMTFNIEPTVIDRQVSALVKAGLPEK
ncbi:adenylate/guanylate cyclase domain-containing protein (plasmid) [Rhizobium grahamii]|uniref:Adenylate/guanylate cyclase domain-containing protein n=1 Tax=Rhizobium grahamii TaxID=1120045 RepID=A0A5Q0CDD2_9HYPH|nr:adenylate/guanylate cyclase domain-containing protein [Rhizobium grahamii]QFY63383.1 adenylate/guanylate cyclase domain-containing protein [Rhizobium grahamii]